MMEVLDLFEPLLEKREALGWKPFQVQAWKKLQEVGFPKRKEESFQYVTLRKLYDSISTKQSTIGYNCCDFDVSSFVMPESQSSYLIFKDGLFCPELSSVPSSLVVLPLEDALKSSYGSFLKHRMHQLIEKEKDPWALLNGALCDKGVFLYAPPKTKIDSPIQILNIQEDSSLVYEGPRVHIFVGARAEVQVVSTFHFVKESTTLHNDFLDVFLEESAKFSHTFSNENMNQSWGFSSFRAALKKESKLDSTFVTFGSPGFRRDYFVSLLGEHSKAHLKGLTALGDSSQSHINIYMDHSAPACISRQFFKNVLATHSLSSFTGKIYVKREAQKTEAYQMNQNLLLSDQATANSKPNLEIFADDVKASHGATVSQLDEEQIFYLRTRGVSLPEAKSLLTSGFCQEILDSIEVLSLRDKLSQFCRQFLKDLG
jgi:Fe-S cluster assembly protein SufD